MTDPRSQKPSTAESNTGLSPVQIGVVLGLAALVWMFTDLLRGLW